MQRKLTKKRSKIKDENCFQVCFVFFWEWFWRPRNNSSNSVSGGEASVLTLVFFFYPSYARINSPDLCLWMSKELLTCWQFFPSLPHWSSTGDTDISGSGWLQTVEMVWTAAFRSSHPHESSLIIAELWTRLHEKHLPWLHHLHEFI